MKANEAPEKLYFSTTENGTHYYTEGIPFEREYIEYIRTDALIEKACEWLSANADKYIWYSDYAENTGDDICGMNDNFIEDFKKYMKN